VQFRLARADAESTGSRSAAHQGASPQKCLGGSPHRGKSAEGDQLRRKSSPPSSCVVPPVGKMLRATSDTSCRKGDVSAGERTATEKGTKKEKRFQMCTCCRFLTAETPGETGRDWLKGKNPDRPSVEPAAGKPALPVTAFRLGNGITIGHGRALEGRTIKKKIGDERLPQSNNLLGPRFQNEGTCSFQEERNLCFRVGPQKKQTRSEGDLLERKRRELTHERSSCARKRGAEIGGEKKSF